MSIVFATDAGIQQNSTSNFFSGLVNQFSALTGSLASAFQGISNSGLTFPQNIYVDTGYENVPGTTYPGATYSALQDFKQRNIITQEPQATVFIKKRAFSSLRSENDTRFSDDGDKLYLRATKILFQNKCNQISAYEAVTKVQQLLSEETPIDIIRLEALYNLVSSAVENMTAVLTSIQTDPNSSIDEISNATDALNSFTNDNQKILNIIDAFNSIKNLILKEKQATTTTWVIDSQNNTDIYNVGPGSGVIELTLVSNIRTELSLDNNGDLGSFSFTMQDPYHLTNINEDDIEMALAAAYNQAADLSSSGTGSNQLNTLTMSAQSFLENARSQESMLQTIRNERLNNAYGTTYFNTSNQGQINFSINLSTDGPNSVTAMVAGYPQIFNSTTYSIILSQLPPNLIPTPQEFNLISSIFNLLSQYVTAVQRQANLNSIQTPTADLQYARRQMRLHYLGKGIVQPMDNIYLFMRSKTQDFGQIQGPVSALLNNTTFIQTFMQNYLSNSDQLKNEIKQFNLEQFGITPDLYKLLRSQSFLRNAGACVFVGLASNISETYSADSGVYTTEVSGENNLKYLNNSRVNVSPSLDQARSFLEDPLTPFELNIDPGTGLVLGAQPFTQSNINRITNEKLAFATGTYAGQFIPTDATPNTLNQNYTPFNGTNIPQYQHAPGLVYKWKQGIVSISANISLKNSLMGTGLDSDVFNREIGQTVVTDPFANQDIADVCSLVVTGFPHNYEAFILNSQVVGTYTFNDPSNSPISYFHKFFDIQRSNNRALGNFLPYKPIKIDSNQLTMRLNNQMHLNQNSTQLSQLQSQQATIQDQINQLTASAAIIQNSDATTNARRTASLNFLNTQLANINSQITSTLTNIQQNLSSASSSGFNNYGTNLNNTLNGQTAVSASDSITQSDYDAKVKSQYMQLRTQLSVKYNTDTNLFIVDDAYDKDADIQVFVQQLKGNSDFFDSTFKKPLDIAVQAANIVNYEFFCDTQGNINLRPPQYNKTPLTILLRMFQLNNQNGNQIFPPFLQTLFQNQLQNLQNQQNLLSLEIQQYCLLLNIDPPQPSKSTIASLANIYLDNVVIKDIAAPYSAAPSASDLLSINNQIAAASNTPATENTQQNLDMLTQQIAMYQDPNNPNVNTNRLTLFTQLQQLLSQKQQVDANVLKASAQQNTINNLNSQQAIGFNTAVTGQNQVMTLLQPFSDIIEDDITDTIGPDSSKRFMITDDKVIRYTFTENDSNISIRMDVTGQIPLTGDQNGEIGGVSTIWAGATDFDLWRQYGYRSSGAVNVPFFTDADSQCAPYALMLLSRQRKDIVRGQITVVGNEYYQLGDVVYVSAKDLLYYVTRITHNFNYENGSFFTDLELRYGHTIGEYIPTPTDVIGKNLIKNYSGFNQFLQNRITANKNAGVLLGVVSFPNSMKDYNDTVETLQSKMLTGDLGTLNVNALKNALIVANTYVTDTNPFPKIELRTYFLNQQDQSLFQERMQVVQNWFISPTDVASTDPNGNQLLNPLDKNVFKYLTANNFTSYSTTPTDFSGSIISQADQTAGRIPKEELRNVSTVGGPDEGVEIVLVYQ